jgi:hypothetical protein
MICNKRMNSHSYDPICYYRSRYSESKESDQLETRSAAFTLEEEAVAVASQRLIIEINEINRAGSV